MEAIQSITTKKSGSAYFLTTNYETRIKYQKKKKKDEYIITEKTHRYREQTSGFQWGDGKRRGKKKGRELEGTIRRYKIKYKNAKYSTGDKINIL